MQYITKRRCNREAKLQGQICHLTIHEAPNNANERKETYKRTNIILKPTLVRQKNIKIIFPIFDVQTL